MKALWAGLATLALPLFLIIAATSKKLKSGLRERLGGGKWRELEPQPSVWIHAASVGEIQGVKPVLQELCRRTKLRIVMTTTSLTGREVGKGLEEVVFCELLPIDHPLCLRRVVKRICPRVLIVFETELWPNLFYENRSVCIVNGRISDRALPRYRFLAPLLRPVMARLAKVLVQSERDSSRFRLLGVSSPVVSGSTKYDLPIVDDPISTDKLREEFGIPKDSLVLVAGSVRPGEGEILLSAFGELQKRFPRLKLVYAPRHPERFEAEAELISKSGFKFVRRTNPTGDEADIFLLDSLGELRIAYQLGLICFVGGTLVKVGGHNPLEPAALGKPVLMGPYTANVEDVAQDLMTAGGAFLIESEDSIVSVVADLLSDEALRNRAGLAARGVATAHRGAVERILAELEPTLQECGV